MKELTIQECSNVSGGWIAGVVGGIIIGKIVDYYIGDELEAAVEGMLSRTDDYDGMRTAP